ncbi:MAG: ribokinase [Anaerolineae bacterium]|nr:ribokinase [Anaerolineae bacterium]
MCWNPGADGKSSVTEPIPSVTVVGSFAVGLTLRAERFPVKGETLLGRDFDMGPGGKGSNQAVQAARLGANVEFVGRIGADNFGAIGKQLYTQEQVDTTYLFESPDRNTGVGFIVLDAHGDNFILLDPGANELFSTDDVDRARERIQTSNVLITQLEIPLETAGHALKLAHDANVISILNPAPARRVPPEILQYADLVTPNETELRLMLGRAPDDNANSIDLCDELIQMGVRRVILTRGVNGATIVTHEGYHNMPAFRVRVVDTTGAGDAFNGTLATYLARGIPLEPAVRYAGAAGALACTRLGVIPSLPHPEALEQLMNAG